MTSTSGPTTAGPLSRAWQALLQRYPGRALTLVLLLGFDAVGGAVRLSSPPVSIDAGEHLAYVLLYLGRLTVLALALAAPRQVAALFVPILALLTIEALPISAMLDDPVMARTHVTIVVGISVVVALFASLRGLVGYLAVASAVIVLLVATTSSRTGSVPIEAGYSVLGCVFPALVLHHYRRRLGEARAAAEELARVDPLTGALNRRGLAERLDELTSRARRDAREVWLLVLDLDHFKRVNDELGHLAGDEVIRLAATSVRQAVRAGDLLARTGGEEFVVVALGEVGEAGDLGGYADRVHLALDRALAGYAVTGSVGAAAAGPPAAGESPTCWFDALVGRADAALYEAKRAGRDRVVLAGDPVPVAVSPPAPAVPGPPRRPAGARSRRG